jgi:hypothetical protein
MTFARNRLVSGLAAALALALTTACSTATVQPAASPRTGGASGGANDADGAQCSRDGGIWRSGFGVWGGGVCEMSSGGAM